MNGLTHVLLRELLDQLRTFRFAVVFLLIQATALTSVFLAVRQDRQDRAFYEQVRSDNRAQLARSLRGEAAQGGIGSGLPYCDVFWTDVRFCRPPASLPFVAGAGSRSLPSVYKLNLFRLKGPEYLRPANPTMRYAESIDWGFIAGIVLSLAALVLTFDAVSREREDKTYHMVMSHSVRRGAVVAGKALGAFLPLIAAWAVAAVLQLLVWNLLAAAPLAGRDWVVAFLAGIPIALLAAFFVCLGVLISLWFNSTGACGTVAALCWAFIVLVIPNAGQLAASRLQGLPDPKVSEARAEETIMQTHLALREQGLTLGNRYWSASDPLGPHMDLEGAYNKEWAAVRNQWKAQARLARGISRLSPVAALRCALEELAVQGLPGYEALEKQAEEYHQEIRTALLSWYPLRLDEPTDRKGAAKLRAAPLTLDAYPAPPSRVASVADRLTDAGPDLALLVLFAGIAFTAAVTTAVRQDVTG